MATYKASPSYVVSSGDIAVRFDVFGSYETEDAAEIAVLDALCPTWIKRVEDEDKPEESADKPAAKTPAPRKSSAK